MDKDETFVAILVILGCIYCLYFSTVGLLWCGKICLSKVQNTILPLYTIKHKYVVQMSHNTWTALKATTEVWLSIQGKNGSSNFYALPRKVASEDCLSLPLPKNFIIETSACLKQLMTLTIHVKGRDLQLWDVDKIVVHDVHHNISYTFSLQCTLVIPMCATIYVVSIEKKAMTHLMYGKLAFQVYHNWIAVITKLTLDTDVSPNVNLSLILCTLVSSLLSALIVVSRQTNNDPLDANEVIQFISFFYLLITNLAIDVIIHWSKRRGKNKMVWGHRPLSYRTRLEKKYVAVASKISLDTQNRMNSLMSAIADNPMIMIQEGITPNDVDMITAIKVATIKQRERLLSSSSTFAEEELTHYTNPDYQDRYVSTTSSVTTNITHTGGYVAPEIPAQDVAVNVSPPKVTAPTPQTEESNVPTQTIASCLFYPFNSNQLLENRVYLWVNFLEKWNVFGEVVMKYFLKFAKDNDDWKIFGGVTDLGLVRQEIMKLNQIAKDFQKEKARLERFSFLGVHHKADHRMIRTFALGSMSEHRALYILLREAALHLTADLLDAVRYKQLEHRLPLNLRYSMEDKLKDLVMVFFEEGYLVKNTPRVIITANTDDLPSSSHQPTKFYYPPDHPSTFSSGVGLSEVTKSKSIASFHSDSSSIQIIPRTTFKRSLSLPNVKVGSDTSQEDISSVAGISREDILLTWGQWISTLVDIMLKKAVDTIKHTLHGMVFSEAVEYIQMQAPQSTWNEGCAEYVNLLCSIIIQTLIESICVFLGSNNRKVILKNLQETLKSDVTNAVSHTESSFMRVVANRYEDLMFLLKESIDRNHKLTDDPMWHNSLQKEQYRLLYLLNGKITVDHLKNQPELSKTVNDVLFIYIRQLDRVKRSVAVLREEMEIAVFTKQWRSRQEILVKCVDLLSQMIELEKFIGKVELHLDALYLDVPHVAMDFEYSDVNMLCVDQILSAYFGDTKDILYPKTVRVSSYKQYLKAKNENATSLLKELKNQDDDEPAKPIAGSKTVTKPLDSSDTRRVGVVIPRRSNGVLDTAQEMNRDLLTFLRNPCRPSLSYFCRQGTIAFLVAEIFFVTVAVIILSSSRDHHVETVLYIMIGAIMCDFFILQPAKCSLFFVTQWLYQHENVYELYESDTLTR